MKPPPPPRVPRPEEVPVRAAELLEARRRGQRVLVRMPVLMHVPGRPQPLRGVTLAVSATGAMLLSTDPLPVGTKLVVENPQSQRKAGASVTRASKVTSEGAIIPVEFAEPAPSFWNIFFPPAAS